MNLKSVLKLLHCKEKCMKILFLDDDERRHELYKKYFDANKNNDDILYQTYTAKDTINLLNTESPFDVVQLDHDLGGEVYVTRIEETGYEVALFIETMEVKKLPRTVVIHSYNTSGALRMYTCIYNKMRDTGNSVIISPFHF